jgi:hypothetical protein
MDDPFPRWLDALDARHRRELSFQEVRRGVQALSSLYVERRGRISEGAALEGAGKRAAFATFFAPLHFLLIREIVRSLGLSNTNPPGLLDLGCGTGAAGAAWAVEAARPPRVLGVDRNAWAVQEARWTYGVFGLENSTKTADISRFKLPAQTAVVAAFILNELSEEGRNRWCDVLVRAVKEGVPVLIVEPIAPLRSDFHRGGTNGRMHSWQRAGETTNGAFKSHCRSASL